MFSYDLGVSGLSDSHARRGPPAPSYKRRREDGDAMDNAVRHPPLSSIGSSGGGGGLALVKPSEATPCRRPVPVAAASPPPRGGPHGGCYARWLDEDSRSPSHGTATTDGLSEDSVFLLELSSTQCPEGGHSREAAPQASNRAANEADATAWQQQLSDFFSRLDHRPLRVAPRE